MKLNTNDKQFIKNCKAVQKGEMTLEELISTLKCRFYIPIKVKYTIADLINIMTYKAENEALDEISQEEAKDRTEYFLQYDIIKTMFILSQYIGVQISIVNCTEENYDLISEIGLVNYVKNKCDIDFKEFDNIVDRITGINYDTLTESFFEIFKSLPTKDKINEYINEINNIDESTLSKLERISNFNNPIVAEIQNTLNTVTLEEIKNTK